MVRNDGQRAAIEGRPKYLLQLVKVEFEVDFYAFNVGGLDLVSGSSWLGTLRMVGVDWQR